MGTDFQRTAIESSFRRRVGASEEARVRLKEANLTAKDWHGTCPKCGQVRIGTVVALRLPHDCGDK